MTSCDHTGGAQPERRSGEHHPVGPFTSGCITCGDEAVAMQVLQTDEERGLALCADERGRRETVEIALVDAAEGDTLMVHAATAIARVEGQPA